MSQLGRFAAHSGFGDTDPGARSSAAMPQRNRADLHNFEDLTFKRSFLRIVQNLNKVVCVKW